MVCSWKQIILMTMVACKFVSVIILPELCVCMCVLSVVIWLVFTAGCSAVRQLILARGELAYRDKPAFAVVWANSERHNIKILA